MNKIIQLLLVLSLGILPAQAQSQQGKIKGQLTDQTTKEAMPAATIVLLHAKDSTVAITAVTDNKGNFEITSLADGPYRLYISFLGYKPINKPVQITPDNKQIALGNITMEHKGVNLNTVEILDEKPPIVVKKDTLEFNADAFKTRENAVVEDLLKKLPGVTVDKDGAVTAQGETVTKILVDGKPFFGNDPKLATKNLPAAIIDKVQVIDKKSDQAQFTQIDDGQTEKTINITIKKDKKKGMFGRATAGYGTDDRFGGSFSLNRMRENQQLSLLGGGNNVNDMGYTLQDQMSFSSAGGGGSGKGGGGRGGAMAMQQNLGGGNNTGITRNWNAGLSFNQDYGKKLIVNGSYFFNDTKTDVIQKKARQTFQGDSTIYNNNNSLSQTDNSNNRFNVRIEYQIDSLHSLIFSPTYSLTNGNSFSITDYQSLNSRKDTMNKGITYNDGQGNNQNVGGSLLFRKRFKKPGRTLSANFSYNNVNNQQQNYNKSSVVYFNPDSMVTFNQRNQINTDSRNAGANITYTEPVAKDRYLEANYGFTKYNSNSTKYTYDYDNSKGGYNVMNDSLSNAFTNNTLNQQTGISLRTNKLKYDYSFGINVLFNDLDNLTHSFLTGKDSLIHQSTVNFAPSASFNYTFSKNKRLRIYYNGSTQQPTVQQLQPVPDNSNPLYIQLGNPDLKPSFNNTLRVNFNQFNNITFRGMFASFTGSFGTNKIVNSTTLDDKGKQTSKPVNVNGYFNLRGMLHNSIPLSKTPGQNLNTGTTIIYGRDVNVVDGKTNYSKSLQLSQSASVNYMYKEWLDVSLGGGVNYNATDNTLSKTQNTHYLNYNINTNFNINLPYGFMIGSDVTCTMNRGLAAGYNLTSTMWNANIAKYVFPKKQGMIKIQGFDLLKQYINISRTVSDNYIEDVQSNVLQQYFMVSFTYFLNKFGGNMNKGEKGYRMGFPPGGGRGGFRPGGF
ncbi:outer membrane receptor protein involved in Fe transport [Chitinophaga niastensis]|uniref:Outer membrane receptor protein involved in Fe transport n=1 Tax=Chitinophaga niastensis TaxID=536980 RepID=A0A2P8HT10_CHINA|nr:TonB-dependent receptor [Chitinophaga niastensis]PSL49353.1 outer membrane receptor protein involved in Fe transport [Chitinophaga niastensis]